MRTRRRFGVAVLGMAALALLLVGAGPGRADPLVVQLPDGTFQTSGFRTGAGNVLLQGAVPFVAGSTVNVYSQALVSAVLGSNGQPLSLPGLNATYELTEVSRYTAIVTSVSMNGNSRTIGLSLAPAQTNPFYEVWFHNGIFADNFNGTGFAAGTKILSGVVGSLTNDSFTIADTTKLSVPIDNPFTAGGTTAGRNFWNGSGTVTVQGSGGTTASLATMLLNSVVLNPAFFPGGQTVTSFSLTRTSGLEYQNVDPSKQFDSLPNGGGFTPLSIAQGSNNGLTPGNMLLEFRETDSISATPAAGLAATTAAVPEPSTLALLALGGGALAGWRRWRAGRGRQRPTA